MKIEVDGGGWVMEDFDLLSLFLGVFFVGRICNVCSYVYVVIGDLCFILVFYGVWLFGSLECLFFLGMDGYVFIVLEIRMGNFGFLCMESFGVNGSFFLKDLSFFFFLKGSFIREGIIICGVLIILGFINGFFFLLEFFCYLNIIFSFDDNIKMYGCFVCFFRLRF